MDLTDQELEDMAIEERQPYLYDVPLFDWAWTEDAADVELLAELEMSYER